MTGTGAFLYLRPEPAPAGIAQVEKQAAPKVNAEPDAEKTPPVEVAPEVATRAPEQRKRRYRRRLLALTGIAATLVLVGLQLGELGDPGSLGAEAPIDWDRFRSAWQAARAG